MHIIFYNLCIFWKEYTYFENSNFRNISVNFQIELISSRFMLRCLKCNHLAMWSSGRNSSQNHIVSGVATQKYCIKLTQYARVSSILSIASRIMFASIWPRARWPGANHPAPKCSITRLPCPWRWRSRRTWPWMLCPIFFLHQLAYSK